MIIFGLGARQIVAWSRSPMNRFGTPGLRTTQQGSWAQWYQERPDREEALVPDDLAGDLEADAERGPAATSSGVDAGVPDVADLEARARGRTPRTSRPGCRTLIVVLRWPAVRPWRATGGPCGVVAVGLAIGPRASCTASRRRPRRPSPDPLARPVVHAVAPGRVELHAVGRVGREERRRRAVEQPRHVVGLRRVAAQEAVVAEHARARPA